MKLSTAIRKGVKRDGKQAFGEFFEYDDIEMDKIVGCCALGAAMIGVEPGLLWDPLLEPNINSSFAQANEIEATCPVRGCRTTDHALWLVPHMNDDHKWKRERIADWLEGIGL